MAEPDRQEILLELKRGHNALRDAGVDEQLAARKPSSGGWSILDSVEHLAVSEQFLFSRLTTACRSDRSHENPSRETMIVNRGLDRSRSVPAPEAVVPAGRFESVRDAISAFDSARARTIQFVEAFTDDFRCCVTDHPLISGPVNLYEILLMVAIHPVRHARQIRETRTAIISADRRG
jgi:hypothetical protein